MSDDPYSRPSGVLQNTLNSDDVDRVNALEDAITSYTIKDIDIGNGPDGNFDKDHLKALHGAIFGEVYPWAGHMRHEEFQIGDTSYSPVNISKGNTAFVPTQYIDQGLKEALKPIQERELLNDQSEFVEKAGQVLGELNYVHPFREGNGRTQRAFVSELGRAHGHTVDFSHITRARMTEASINTTNNPESPDLRDIVHDATDPSRQRALEEAWNAVEISGHNPNEHVIRTGQEGERVSGQVFGLVERTATIATENGVVVVDQRDLPEEFEGKIEVEVNHSLSQTYSDTQTREGEHNPQNAVDLESQKSFTRNDRGDDEFEI